MCLLLFMKRCVIRYSSIVIEIAADCGGMENVIAAL